MGVKFPQQPPKNNWPSKDSKIQPSPPPPPKHIEARKAERATNNKKALDTIDTMEHLTAWLKIDDQMKLHYGATRTDKAFYIADGCKEVYTEYQAGHNVLVVKLDMNYEKPVVFVSRFDQMIKLD